MRAFCACWSSRRLGGMDDLRVSLHEVEYRTEVRIRLKDNTIRNRVLTLTPQDRKRLGINKSTLWYMQKHIREGKRIKVYGKIMNKLGK